MAVLKNVWNQKMGGQVQCSDSVDGIAIQAAKCLAILIFCDLNCDFYFHQYYHCTALGHLFFDFTCFSTWPFFSSWPQLFYSQGVFGWNCVLCHWCLQPFSSLPIENTQVKSNVEISVGNLHESSVSIVWLGRLSHLLPMWAVHVPDIGAAIELSSVGYRREHLPPFCVGTLVALQWCLMLTLLLFGNDSVVAPSAVFPASCDVLVSQWQTLV